MGFGTTIPSITFKGHSPFSTKTDELKEQIAHKKAQAEVDARNVVHAQKSEELEKAPVQQDAITKRSKTSATTINCGLFKVQFDKPLSEIDKVLSGQNLRGVQAFFKRNGVVNAAHALNQPHVRNIAIPTGFSVTRDPDTNQPLAETDGPPGAVILGEAQRKAGKNVVYVVDSQNRPLLEAGLKALYPEWKKDPKILISVFNTVLKTDATDADKTALRKQANDLLKRHKVNAVVAVELPARSAGNKYSNMVGNEINDINSARDELLLAARDHNAGKKTSEKIITCGVGDGGNEAGMGNRKGIKKAISGDEMKSYVPADYPITAWNSNLGGIALGCVTAALNGQLDQFVTPDDLEKVIVATLDAGGVDGCTRSSTRGQVVENVIGKLVTGVDGKDIAVHRDDLERLKQAVAKEVSPPKPSLVKQFQEYRALRKQLDQPVTTPVVETAPTLPTLEFDKDEIVASTST